MRAMLRENERVERLDAGTMVENRKEHRCKCWATRSPVRSFARTAHSFACSGLLALLAPSAALTRLLARSLCSLPRSWESEFLMSQNDLVLSHSAPPRPRKWGRRPRRRRWADARDAVVVVVVAVRRAVKRGRRYRVHRRCGRRRAGENAKRKRH